MRAISSARSSRRRSLLKDAREIVQPSGEDVRGRARVARELLAHALLAEQPERGRRPFLSARAQRVAHDARRAGRARVLALDVADRDPDVVSPIAKTS